MRHDRVRDLEASLLKGIYKDVRTEPALQPIATATVESANLTDKARLDVSAVGIWSPMERTFLDVRVTHPNAPTHREKTMKQIFEDQEREKKNEYNQRIMQIEKATFTPLVFSTMGGMAKECARYHKRIATLISNKTKEDYSNVVNHIRTRVRFSILKSTLVAIRGQRGKPMKEYTDISELSFNTLPDMPSYEV